LEVKIKEKALLAQIEGKNVGGGEREQEKKQEGI